MDVQFRRESDSKTVPLQMGRNDSVQRSDNITISRTRGTESAQDIFNSPGKVPDDLGMEYLIDSRESLERDPSEGPNGEIEDHGYGETEGHEGFDYEDPGNFDPLDMRPAEAMLASPVAPQMTQEQIDLEKAKGLSRLNAFRRKGYEPRRLTMEHTLTDINAEVARISMEAGTGAAINQCRFGLMFIVSSLERLNESYDPLSINLCGWSQNVASNIDDFDEPFEELYQKYYDSINTGPEVKLALLLAYSAYSYSANNPRAPKRRPGGAMSGPDYDDEELLRQLNDADSISGISGISDVSDPRYPESRDSPDEMPIVIETKAKKEPKKRGRPPKVKVNP